MENKSEPEIRFPEFLDKWEERSLGEILIDVKRELKMVNDEVYQLVTVKRRNGGIISRGFYKGSEVLVKSQFTIKKGDYLISKRQVVHGATGIVPDYLDGSIVSNEYHILHGTKSLNIEFFSLISELPSMYKKFLLSSHGVDIEKLLFNVDDWKKRKILIPSILEQNKIVSFIEAINKVITIHNQELATLKQTRQGFLQKLLPKEGESQPELRFPGFTGDWEERKFKDFISKAGKKNSIDENYPAYSVSNKFGLVSQTEQFDRSRLDNLDKTSYKIVNPKEFAYNPARINVGSIAFNNLNKIVIVSSLYVVIEMSEKLDNEFVLQYIKSDLFINEVKKNTEGSVREYLFFESFKNVKLPYTANKEEQIKIGNFFKKLDEIIALYEKELEVLHHTKKAFLQKMFV